MESKLITVFLFLLVLPIGALSYLSANRYSQSIEDNTVTYALQVSDKMVGKLDDYIEDMKKISIIPSYLDEIKAGLKMSNHFYEEPRIPSAGGAKGVLSEEELMRLNIQRQVENSIYFMNNIKQGTNTVYLFDLYGHAYFAVKSSGVRSDLASVYPSWERLAASANGAPVLVSTQEVTERVNSKRYVFTVVRRIIDTSFRPLGTIAVDANIGVIENIVKDLDQATQGTTLIVDSDGQVIYDSEKKYLGQNYTQSDLLANAKEARGSFHAIVNGERVLTIYRQSETTGWRVLITIPEKQLMAGALRIRNFTVAAAVAIVCFAMAISFWLIFALTRPLRSLVRLMKEVQTGNLNVVFPVRSRDEAGLVGGAFNRMIDRVKSLIDDIHRIEQRKKEVELESLQRQINPHFIYNTLESIRMTAVLHDDAEVGDMAHLLGKLLRYSIHAGTETVPLEQEWEHLRMYVHLLNYRYGRRFALELPGDAPKMAVMKLLFQPIVENAVYHGLDEGRAPMTIAIRYRMEKGDHLFIVEDDGVGMDALTLDNLRSFGREPSGGRGIGLQNVHERLKLRYGEDYGLTIDSAPGQGTSVTVRLPGRVSQESAEGRKRDA
jgi:two-component system sensor histidine kinase YesM